VTRFPSLSRKLPVLHPVLLGSNDTAQNFAPDGTLKLPNIEPECGFGYRTGILFCLKMKYEKDPKQKVWLPVLDNKAFSERQTL
jgi:hypothetical protein